MKEPDEASRASHQPPEGSDRSGEHFDNDVYIRNANTKLQIGPISRVVDSKLIQVVELLRPHPLAGIGQVRPGLPRTLSERRLPGSGIPVLASPVPCHLKPREPAL